MRINSVLFTTVLLTLIVVRAKAQAPGQPEPAGVEINSGLLKKLGSRIEDMDHQLDKETNRYMESFQSQQQKLLGKIGRIDSNAAKNLLTTPAPSISGYDAYHPCLDSTKVMLSFLKSHPQLMAGKDALSRLQHAAGALDSLEKTLSKATAAKAFIQQQRQKLESYANQNAALQNLVAKDVAGMKQDQYYYSQQLRQYKEYWDHPDQAAQKAITLLNRVPAFQDFMKSNSQLAGLFSVPSGYGSTQSLAGLQTRQQVADQIQNQVSAAGPSGAQALQSNLQSAESKLDGYKDKLSRLGQSNGDLDMPDFKPNDQKSKPFWKRLEYGANLQTTHDNYYFPTVTDFGGSLGYRLGHSNVVGIGASYKVGWGNGIKHIALSSQGLGLRSFVEIKIKSSFSATGGLEYNYTTPFSSFQDLRQIQRWTQSGLIGISKTVSMRSRVFKKTKLQLLWDFLSYQQIPKTQPILFRIGYTF